MGCGLEAVAKTMLTYEEHVTHYKGDTNWDLPDWASTRQRNAGHSGLTTKRRRLRDGNPPIVTS